MLALAAARTAVATAQDDDRSGRAIETAFALGVPRDYASARGLSGVREPQQLVRIGGVDALGYDQRLTPPAADAWLRMREAAARDGVELHAVSTFRSFDVQLAIVRGKLTRGESIERVLRVSAAPGYSEHHSGRAVDIGTPGYAALEEEFERSPAFAWLRRNAHFYGFALSYPPGNAQAMSYEPWHWCWHGDEHSALLSAGARRGPAGIMPPHSSWYGACKPATLPLRPLRSISRRWRRIAPTCSESPDSNCATNISPRTPCPTC
ncbi:MAG: D-alanyl-D-alanine carboxypeptidase family protein [Rudaea sp.]|nr:D-alanyl-D-alanine carboxypeptidase family protein [Rudaea sp.]